MCLHGHILIWPAVNCLCLCELGASFHDHSLRHLCDQTCRGDLISGLHGRRCRGDSTPEMLTRYYFHPRIKRQRIEDAERKEPGKCSVLLFLLCVPVSPALKDMCLFSQSAETRVYLFLSSTSVCMCAELVLHLEDERGKGSIEGHTG